MSVETDDQITAALVACRDALRTADEDGRRLASCLAEGALVLQAREQLRELMRELSEECTCAGWCIGTEDALYSLAHAGGGPWVAGVVTGDDAARLLALSERAGGWWIYPWDEDGSHEDSETFVPGWKP